jgi:hypothetical protein
VPTVSVICYWTVSKKPTDEAYTKKIEHDPAKQLLKGIYIDLYRL